MHAFGEPITIDNVPTPTPGPGEILIRVAGAGLCRSDLHVLDGRLKDLIPSLPWILGHENAGWVESVGPGVTGVDLGMAVAVFGGWGCGTCRFCTTGEEQQCDIMRWVGHGSPGGLAEYLVVPRSRYVVPLGELDPVSAAPLTDAGLTPYRAVRRVLHRIRPDGWVLLIGLGGLGHLGLQILKALTPARVAVVEVVPSKRKVASSLGADLVLDPNAVDVAAEVAAHTSNEGVDVVFDFVGTDATLMSAAQSVGRGGRVVLVGLAGGRVPFAFKNLPLEAGLVTSSWGNLTELREVLDLATRGRIVSHVERFRLADINEAVSRLRAGQIDGRAVIVPGT